MDEAPHAPQRYSNDALRRNIKKENIIVKHLLALGVSSNNFLEYSDKDVHMCQNHTCNLFVKMP